MTTVWPRGVPGTRFADIRHLSEVDSTNRLVADAARDGAPEGMVVVADHQTAGRGRLGRRWEAPAGSNLLVSVLLRPTMAWEDLFWCATAVALAAADACTEVAGVTPGCKWPNDLVVDDRKLAGLLAETVGSRPVPVQAAAGSGRAAAGPQAVVVGLGLNVGWAPSQVPVGALAATSLVAAAAHDVARSDVLTALLRQLEGRLARLGDADGRAGLRAEYTGRCVTLGRPVTVHLAGGARIDGTASEVTDQGALVVADGTRRQVVTVGDVVHVRSVRRAT